MGFFDLLSMAGGLALFLYGMNLMGDGLSCLAGGRMERVLSRLTDNSVKAVLVGMGVTALIQSSSAATVMVVGFVNSGIMRLEQAVGIIMGANIGTTVTSWILGMAGIRSDFFPVRLLQPTSLSSLLAVAGAALCLSAGGERRKRKSDILMGFALLLWGMETMGGAVEPLSRMPGFGRLFVEFANPILGMLAGIALTAAIQSSSASVGILQALCMTGSVSYGAAIPIIMGQNIGTCVTALLSGIGATVGARRAAMVHLYFNVMGTALFMAVFYGADSVRPFAFLQNAATPLGIAAIHSIFNIVSTVCLLPCSGLLIKLSCLTVREAARGTKAPERFAPPGKL